MDIELARVIVIGCVWLATLISCRWLKGMGILAFMWAVVVTLLIWEK